MSMIEWAERECNIRKEKEECYGRACYDSALKAFKSLCEDGHSGMSIRFTQNILNRLIDGKPLSPIEDTGDVWRQSCVRDEDGSISYQCTRMSSLFKEVYPDGTVKYHDNNRYTMREIGSDTYWHNSLTQNLGKEMFPLTMPYSPYDKPYVFECEELLTDRKNGDFDTEGVLFVKTPEGEQLEINRFFREPHEGEEPTYCGWVEITAEEYAERIKLDAERKQMEAQES